MENSLTLQIGKFKKRIELVSGVQSNIFSISGLDFLDNPPAFCRDDCPYSKDGKCNYNIAHRFGAFEAQRWNNRYIYYCYQGFIFLANSFKVNENEEYAFITGPINMENLSQDIVSDPELCNGIPAYTTEKVNALSELIRAVTYLLKKDETTSYISDLHNAMYDISTQTALTYPIEFEKQLERSILKADKKASQEALNMLLGYIYYGSADFEKIKSRVTELIVLLSRAAIDGGADINEIFLSNENYLKEIGNYKNLDDLGAWLTRIMHRFISYVFDFRDVKHTNTIYKAISYINENYYKKITLDDVAEYSNFSKSYLSRIFKSEIGFGFTEYVNNIRIEKSKELLLNEKYSLISISNAVGFEDQSYFTKVFRKITGVSPGKYRQLRGKI